MFTGDWFVRTFFRELKNRENQYMNSCNDSPSSFFKKKTNYSAPLPLVILYNPEIYIYKIVYCLPYDEDVILPEGGPSSGNLQRNFSTEEIVRAYACYIQKEQGDVCFMIYITTGAGSRPDIFMAKDIVCWAGKR